MIKNPAFKGVWKAPRIANPAYKGNTFMFVLFICRCNKCNSIITCMYVGPWTPRQIPNPGYFEDLTPAVSMAPIAALAVEVWTINAGMHFDNFIIARSLADAWSFADETFVVKQKAESVKEKKEKKEKAKVTREELKKTGKVQDKITAVAFEVQEIVEDLWETNAPAVVGSGIAFLVLLVFLCWPRRSSKSVRIRGTTSASAPEPTVAASAAAAPESTSGDETTAIGDKAAASTSDTQQ